MSTTFSTGKKLTLFIDTKGNEWWLMQEETYESNVFPQRKSWSQIGFGDTQTTRNNIIRYSAACEGGCLQGASGPIMAESYISQWRSAMVLPNSCEDLEIEVKKCGYAFNDEMRQKGQREMQELSEKLAIKIDSEAIRFKASQCTPEQLQILSEAMHNRSRGLRYEFSMQKHKSATDSWMGEHDSSEVNVRVSHAIGIQTRQNKYFAIRINDNVYFDQGWGVQAEIVRYLASLGLTLNEASKLCKLIRLEFKEASQFLTNIRLKRPTNDWHYDHIIKLEELFVQSDVITVDIDQLSEIEAKIYCIDQFIDASQFNFDSSHQEALFA